MVSIPRLSVRDSRDALVQALDHAGCLVVTGAADRETREAVRTELDPHMQAARVARDDPAAFYPGKTRRVTALVGRSKTVGTLILDPTVTAMCDHFLGPSCERYHLHVTAALEVGPGARSQVLHREDDSFPFFALPRPHLIVATMWAISDFRADNGATLLVPGSHRWDADRKPEPHEVLQAEMSAGSLLFWAGGTLHGAGPNTSDDWRYGVVFTYALGWLRQEENQYLDVPARLAEELSPELRAMIGYKMHGALGFYDPNVARGG